MTVERLFRDATAAALGETRSAAIDDTITRLELLAAAGALPRLLRA